VGWKNVKLHNPNIGLKTMTQVTHEIDLEYRDFLYLAEKGIKILKNILTKNPYYYAGIVCPLRGGFYFTDFVARRIPLPVHYLYISSYGNEKVQKDFKIHFLPELKPHQRYLICDDILATGNTIKKILELYPHSKFEAIVLYKHKNQDYPIKHYAIREVDSSVWVNFFWEKTTPIE
jgi:hypoxanthine phosphoribosyltransferase